MRRESNRILRLSWQQRFLAAEADQLDDSFSDPALLRWSNTNNNSNTNAKSSSSSSILASRPRPLLSSIREAHMGEFVRAVCAYVANKGAAHSFADAPVIGGALQAFLNHSATPKPPRLAADAAGMFLYALRPNVGLVKYATGAGGAPAGQPVAINNKLVFHSHGYIAYIPACKRTQGARRRGVNRLLSSSSSSSSSVGVGVGVSGGSNSERKQTQDEEDGKPFVALLSPLLPDVLLKVDPDTLLLRMRSDGLGADVISLHPVDAGAAASASAPAPAPSCSWLLPCPSSVSVVLPPADAVVPAGGAWTKGYLCDACDDQRHWYLGQVVDFDAVNARVLVRPRSLRACLYTA